MTSEVGRLVGTARWSAAEAAGRAGTVPSDIDGTVARGELPLASRA